MIKLTFAGAAGTVTGSRYVLEHNKRRVLVDCGLFQGYKTLRLRNWAPFPVSPASIEAVILSHAHLDHTGYFPLLVRNGFSGQAFTSNASRDLCEILLPDSGHLQEEEAAYANRHHFSKHTPALPLYTRNDAIDSLERIKAIKFDECWLVLPGLHVTLRHAGHLLGAATVELSTKRGNIVFSGDLGRPHDPILVPPARINKADYLVVESTYGNRLHPHEDSENQLAEIINRTAARGGMIVIPSFAVGRAQTLMLAIYRLKQRQAIPNLPVYLNSPMAIDATAIYRKYASLHHLSPKDCEGMCHAANIVNSIDDARALNALKKPAIIISASGMATGGRVLHQLIAYAPNPKNAIVFAGFQAGGTRGADMVAGAKSVKIFGKIVPVNAEVHQLDSYSAHADADEIMAWLKGFERPPRQTFITHGEPLAADTLRKRIQDELGWAAHVPDQMESVKLDI